MAIENFIYFNGDCRQAVEFYAEVFGLEKPQFMICGDMPGNPDFVGTDKDRAKELIMYAGLKINDSTVMFSDAPNGRKVRMDGNVCQTERHDPNSRPKLSAVRKAIGDFRYHARRDDNRFKRQLHRPSHADGGKEAGRLIAGIILDRKNHNREVLLHKGAVADYNHGLF